MIVCSNCESPQFLQIIGSKIRIRKSTAKPHKIEELYECTLCGSTGSYEYDTEKRKNRLLGDVRETADGVAA